MCALPLGGVAGRRPLEKDRSATCPLADTIARLSLDVFNKVAPSQFLQQQTVVATVALQSHSDVTPEVVALGCGTKYVRWDVLQSPSVEQGLCVVDSHAEVLARRAFQRFLCGEMQRVLAQASSPPDELMLAGAPVHRCAQKPWLVFDTKALGFRLRPGVKVHFYVSSAPCGNATLKKFVKMKKEIFQPLAPFQLPKQRHDPIQISARAQGQVSLSVKRDPSVAAVAAAGSAVSSGDSVTSEEAKTAWKKQKQRQNAVSDATVMLTTDNEGLGGRIHSCSDKIAVWNVLGWQGRMLAALMCSPVYCDSITVGRKCSIPIAQRALCCRLQRFGPEQMPALNALPQFRLQHPVMMGTSIKMHGNTARYQAGTGATFSTHCCWWCLRDPLTVGGAQVFDGTLGSQDTTTGNQDSPVMVSAQTPVLDPKLSQNPPVGVCDASLHILVRQVERAVSAMGAAAGVAVADNPVQQEWQLRNTAYAQVWQLLISHPHLFQGWRHVDDV